MGSISSEYTYFLLWIVILATNEPTVATLQNQIVEWQLESCPVKSYCPTDGMQFNGSFFPATCCASCTCNPKCSNFWNCCHENEKRYITFKTDCRPGYYKKSSYDLQSSDHKKLNSRFHYWMVTTCLDGSKCDLQSLDDHNVTLDDVSPFYSSTYHTLFQDRRCAECNHINNATRCEMKAVRCFDLQLRGKELFKQIKEHCVLVSVPPTDDIYNRISCSNDDEVQLVSRCNASGLWDTYNETTEKLCEDPNGWYPVRSDKHYKNIYCFRCNTFNEEISKDDTQCDIGSKSLSFIDFGQILSLTPDPGSKTEVDVLPRFDGKCAVDEIFDPNHDKCRQLYCPPLTEAMYGSCDTSYSLDGLYYELGVLFLPTSRYVFDSSILNQIDVKFRRDFKRILRSILPVDFFFVNLFQAEIFIEMKMSLVIALSIHFQVSGLTTPGNIHQSLNSLYFKDAIVTFDYSLINLECTVKPFTKRGLMNALHSYERIGDNTYKTFVFGTTNGNSDTIVKIENDMPFPYIIMTENEYCELAAKNHITSGIADSCPLLNGTFLHSSANSSQVFVQLEVFEELVGKSKLVSYTTENTAPGIVSFVTSCISMACIAVAFCLNCLLDRMQNAPMLVFRIGLGNLFIAQGLFQFGSEWVDYRLVCQAVAIGIHYFWLAAVFSFNAFCLLVGRNLQRINMSLWSNELVISILYVFGLPLIFVCINIAYSANLPSPNDRSVGYGSTICHIDSTLMRYLLFAGPIFLTVISNCIIYASIVHTIQSIAVPSTVISNGVRYASVYFRLLLVTGIMWVFGFINEYVQSEVIGYIFIVLVGGQGAIVLFAFTCNLAFCRKISGVLKPKNNQLVMKR